MLQLFMTLIRASPRKQESVTIMTSGFGCEDRCVTCNKQLSQTTVTPTRDEAAQLVDALEHKQALHALLLAF